jgi:BASS family bile acid:Na+ symporter
MTLAQLLPLAVNLSMGLIVLALGLQASVQEAMSLLRRPGLLVRSILSMNVIMVLVVVVLVALFDLHPAIKVALMALALSPVPPILPNKETKAGGTHAYVAGLLVTMAAVAILVVPLGVEVLNQIYGLTRHVPVRAIASVVFIGVILPAAVGLAIRHFAPDLAQRIALPLARLGAVLLVVAFVPILFGIWPLVMSMVGNGTLLILAAFAVIGMVVGHFLGGPDPDDRTVLALATATRHPGVALAVAHATFPDEKAVIAVVLWHLIVSAIVCIPYVSWRKRQHAGHARATVP